MAVQHLRILLPIIPVLVLILCRVTLAYVPENSENFEILRNIEDTVNYAIDPCDDFYEYACGNFANLHNTSAYDDLGTLAMNNFESAVVNIIGREYTVQKHEQSVVDKARIFYSSCESLGKWELLRYLDVLKPAQGLEWPLVKEMIEGANALRTWAFQHFDVLDFVAHLNSYGVRNILINYDPQVDEGKLEGITLWTSDLEELQPKAVDAILKHFGFSNEIATKYRDEILQVHAHWQSIYKSYKENPEQQFVEYSQFKQTFPQFATFLNKSIQGGNLDTEGLFLYISEVNFIQYLMSKQWQPDEKRKFCNYLMVRYLQHVKKNHKLKCGSDLRTKMGLAVNYMYYESHYLPEAQEFNTQISQVIKDLQNNYLKVLNENRMRYNETQMQKILTTIREVIINVGNLPADVNLAEVEEFYSEIPSLDISNFYKNDLLMLRQQELEKFKCQQDYLWTCSRAYASLPFNTVQLNTVFVPFASVNLPFYHYKLDPLFAISSIGFFFGHEFTHSIEVETLLLNEDPLFKNIAENPVYRNSRDCLMQQNPTNDMLERVADLVGSRVAYRTYSTLYGRQPNFTNIPWQQLFFVNLVQPFCTKGKYRAVDHDTDNIRIREIAMNSEDFSAAFECPVGSRMNPVHKCRTYY